jgi:hypothetical protein
MDIKIEKVNVELTGQEARNIAYCIKHSLSKSIDTHYTKLQGGEDGENIFFDMCKEDINMMKWFFVASGDIWNFEDSINEFKKKFAERRGATKIVD